MAKTVFTFDMGNPIEPNQLTLMKKKVDGVDFATSF